MNVYHSFDDFIEIKNPVVTTGSFDGVHLGHKSIIQRLNHIARQIDGESVLITFHPHPRKVLYPDTVGKELFLIYSQEEKILALEKAGLQHLFIIEFTKDFAQTSSIDYARKILHQKLKAKVVVVGFNHNFGHNREGNYQMLFELGQALGFWVEQLPALEIEHESVSSTRIRKAIMNGEIQKANACLDDNYLLIGKIEKINDFYHIAVEEDCKLLPPCGIYAVKVSLRHQQEKALAIIEKFENNQNRTLKLLTGKELQWLNEKAVVLFYKELSIWSENTPQPDLLELYEILNKIEEWIY
ncbi:MAG: FAD synthetase family protein [Bacteroidales bacterium]|nr:FAD synthetase family protein [Bacteroidales bacterium]